MAATTNKFLNLKNVRLTLLSGLVVDCINVRIKRNPVFIDRTAGGSATQQSVYNLENRPDILIEGFNSDDLSFGELIPNDPILSFTLLTTEATPASVLAADFFTQWPVDGMVLGEMETAFNGTDCSTWKVPIVAGVLNPNGA